MKLCELVIKLNGARRLSLSDNEPSLSSREFWGKYRTAPEWEQEVDRIDLIPHSDKVIVLITLKKG